MQCQALLKNSDRQCSRKAEPGSIYCWQHKKIYEVKEEKIIENLETTKFSPALINDINDIVYQYAYTEFNPIESLKYSQLNPKKYPYSQYLIDLEAYKLKIFEELKNYIISEFPKFTVLHNAYLFNNSDTLNNYIDLYKWSYNLIKYVIQEFKNANLDQPIEELLNIAPSTISNGGLEVKLNKKDQLYNPSSSYIYLSEMGLSSNLSKFTKIHYIDLSYFWKLIFIIMFVSYHKHLPHLEEYE